MHEDLQVLKLKLILHKYLFPTAFVFFPPEGTVPPTPTHSPLKQEYVQKNGQPLWVGLMRMARLWWCHTNASLSVPCVILQSSPHCLRIIGWKESNWVSDSWARPRKQGLPKPQESLSHAGIGGPIWEGDFKPSFPGSLFAHFEIGWAAICKMAGWMGGLYEMNRLPWSVRVSDGLQNPTIRMH